MRSSQRASERDALVGAVEHVRAGGLLGYPTETVFGLGADVTSPAAIEGLRAWKGRHGDRPISVLVSGPVDLARLGVDPASVAMRLAERFWPGPLTLVVAAPPGCFAPGVARADGAVGLRCSPHPTARALAEALARAGVGPVSATSLNRSGDPAAHDVAAAAALCAEASAPRLLRPLSEGSGAEGPVSCATPSTVVDCTGPALTVIRLGAVSEAALTAVTREGSE